MAEKDEVTAFVVLLGLAGVGFGIFITVQAFTDPSFPPTRIPIVLLFVPAAVCGFAGAMAGMIIDKILTALKGLLGSERSSPPFSSPPHASQHDQGKLCAQCGADLSTNAKFCGACGYKVAA